MSSEQSPAYYRVVVSSGVNGARQLYVRLRIGGEGRFNEFDLPLGAAYALGAEIVATVDGLLNGARRPWDDDPGRTPFASRSFGRAGARSAPPRPAGERARRRPPTDGYPRPRSVRPNGPVDSGA